MKIFSIPAAMLSTPLVLVWPIALFITPFLFDSPRGPQSDTRIGIFIIVLLSYPLGWLVAIGLILARKIVKSPKHWWQPPIPYFCLIPFAQLVVALLMLTSNFMGTRTK